MGKRSRRSIAGPEVVAIGLVTVLAVAVFVLSVFALAPKSPPTPVAQPSGPYNFADAFDTGQDQPLVTIIGDSYLIKDGRLAAPLKPNTVRMNDNVLRLINSILGIAAQRRATVRWSSDQVTWAPEIAVTDFGLEEISEYMESV